MGNVRKLFAEGGKLYKAIEVEVDGEKSSLYIGKVTVDQRSKFVKLLEDQDEGLARAQAYIVQHCTYDDDQGTRSFTDEAEDYVFIRSAPMQFVHKIAEAIIEFNKLVGHDVVKDAAKN